MITINGQQIEHGDERVREMIEMGKALGLKFFEWYAILKTASLRMELVFHAKEQAILLEVECDCENCRSKKTAHHLSIVPNPQEGVIN